MGQVMYCDHCGRPIDAIIRTYGHRFCGEECAYSCVEDVREDARDDA